MYGQEGASHLQLQIYLKVAEKWRNETDFLNHLSTTASTVDNQSYFPISEVLSRMVWIF